jgi:hypothetical protein
MDNEAIVRRLIRGSLQRAIQESVAAPIVVIAFGAILPRSEAGSARYYGCLLILMGAGFIAGVVWSYALSDQLLRSHPASDTRFWREAFHSQARLLRLAPLWYCAPFGLGALLFVAPTAVWEFAPFLLVSSLFVIVFAGVAWLNRRAAACLDDAARLLAD